MSLALTMPFDRYVGKADNGSGGDGGFDRADRKYLAALEPPSLFRENHFLFFASGPRNAPKRRAPFPGFVIPGTCARALSGAPTCLLWRILPQWRRGLWRFRYEFPAFRHRHQSRIHSQFEKRGISAAKFTHFSTFLTPLILRRRHKWGSEVFLVVIDMRDRFTGRSTFRDPLHSCLEREIIGESGERCILAGTEVFLWDSEEWIFKLLIPYKSLVN